MRPSWQAFFMGILARLAGAWDWVKQIPTFMSFSTSFWALLCLSITFALARLSMIWTSGHEVWGPVLIIASVICFILSLVILFWPLFKRLKHKKPKQLKDERIKIRRLGDQVSEPMDGRTLIKKWGIEANVLLYMTIRRHIKVYNPGMNTIINKPTDHINFYLDTYTARNETHQDVILRFIFKPEDIREFEEKVRNRLLPEYVLLKTKWKRKRKIKREDTKHMNEDKKEDTKRVLVDGLKIKQEVDGVEKADGLKVEDQDMELRNTSVNMKVKNVKEATAVSFKQTNKTSLIGHLVMCECGEKIPLAYTGTPPSTIKCPKCGREKVFKKGI